MEQLSNLLHQFLNGVAPDEDAATQAINLFVFFVQWSAVGLSAVTGLFSARKFGMDIYGAIVIGFVSSIGGGTVRDMLLQRNVFWVYDPAYVVMIAVVVTTVLVIEQVAGKSPTVDSKVERPVKRLASEDSNWFIIIDALALGLWVNLGTSAALQMGTPIVVAPIMGIITASFGGVLRDVFFVRVPQAFMPGQYYAIAAAVGALVFVLVYSLGFTEFTSAVVCFVVTFLVRMLSVKLNIRSH